jgi:hypothetical protein
VFLRHFQKDLRAIEPFAAAIKQRGLKGAALKTANPYHGLPDHHFWKLAVEQIPPSQLNPMTDSPFRVTRTERIATAGSCFAQHIARRLAAQGFNYLVAEQAPPQFDAEQARARSYGLFSARYGNIYTVKQLRQLCERAFGLFTPADGAWPCEGGFIDPFRPRIEPRPFATEPELETSRQLHLTAVRQIFASASTFIFTLGLTEAWRAKSDGAVFPLAPGVVADIDDPSAYEFVNFAYDDIRDDLLWTIRLLRKHNPGLRVILTVSPVPLVATFERRHVLTSTTASKSILRAVADEAARTIPDVMYFPSYEIIASPVMRGSYFAADLRSVTDAGVDHVMRVFFESCAEAGAAARESPDIEASAEDAATARIICDEEQLAARNKEP